MWTHHASIQTTATAERIWALFADVAGWTRWNTGIGSIELHGPFAQGTTFTMTIPHGPSFTSTLIDVAEPAGFSDETVVDDTRVVVHHRIESASDNARCIVFATEVTGPDAAGIGAMVTGDFDRVLAALKDLAERG
jgi:Polyketide cyclase / dehydrase and lipid transport